MQNMYLNILQLSCVCGFFFFLIKFILLQKRVSVIMPVTLSYIIDIILKKLLKVYEKKCLSTKNIIVTNICTERQCRLGDH